MSTISRACSSDGFGLTGEIVREHGAIDRAADDVGDLLRGHFSDASLGDQVTIQLTPALNVTFSMLEISRPLAVLESRPFLDDQFNKVRVFGEKGKIRSEMPR